MLEDQVLDKNTPIPLYYQLKSILIEAIENGSYPEGSMIPTESELQEMFDVSRTTVRQAITEMVQEGRLYRIKSKGTFVSKEKIKQEITNMQIRYGTQVRNSGRVTSIRILQKSVMLMSECPVNYIFEHANHNIIYIYRRRMADDMPIMRVENYLPEDLCRFVYDELETEFISGDTENAKSIVELLNSREETRIYRVSRTLDAILADDEDARVMNVEIGSAIQHIITSAYNRDNRLVNYTKSYLRGDQNSIKIDIQEQF